MIFRNARLIFPDGIRNGLELVVRDGKIVRFASGRIRAQKRLSIWLEIISRLVLSTFTFTARSGVIRWKLPRMHFA